MCKKYVNANLTCFKSIVMDNDVPLAFRNPFDEISVEKCLNGMYTVNGFQILSNINILGTADKDKQKEHILYKEDGKLDFIIRLTKCDPDPSKRIYYDLDLFTVDIKDLRDNHQVDGACFDFVNYARITNIPDFQIEKVGSYVVKLLIKENTEQDYSVQFIKKILIKNS